jgi:hypothetical protein
MKALDRKDIDQVRPKFLAMVEDAWKRGEEVPYGVTYLSDAPITEKYIAWARKNLGD